MLKLEGKVAIVTGGAQGIGRAIALRFAQEGADLVIPDINLRGAEYVVREVESVGRQAFAREVDVTNSAAVNNSVRSTIERFGKVDILVNNAGIGWVKPFWEVSDDEWDAMLRVHLHGCFFFSRAVAKHMIERKEGGRILNISSISGLRGSVGRGPYATAKAGIANFTKVMAVELAKYGINVNAIAPGPILTPLMEQNWEKVKDYPKDIPLRRFGKPEEVADAALFLCSSEASYITGHILAVDGGFLAAGVIERD